MKVVVAQKPGRLVKDQARGGEGNISDVRSGAGPGCAAILRLQLELGAFRRVFQTFRPRDGEDSAVPETDRRRLGRPFGLRKSGLDDTLFPGRAVVAAGQRAP